MKRCGECEVEHGVEVLLCDCGEVLETGHYLRWVGITSVLALAITYALTSAGLLLRFSWKEAFVTEAALLVVMYPTAKLVQWLGDRRRPVWAEMGSVFARRYDRCLILLLLAAIAFIVVMGGGGAGSDLYAPTYAPARQTWLYASTALWLVALALIVRDQGLALFDLRIANTYAER